MQGSLIGQRLHAGFFGVQIADPRSIIACAKSPARVCGVSSACRARMSFFAAGRGVSIAKSRATTRSMFASTTTAGSSYAMAAMAAAV